MHPLECFCAPALPELWFNWIATLNYKYKINNKNELLRGQATIYIYIIIVPTYNNIIRRCLLIITTTMTIATSHKQQQQPNKEFCKAMCIISHVRIITILLYCLMYPIQSPSLLLLMIVVVGFASRAKATYVRLSFKRMYPFASPVAIIRNYIINCRYRGDWCISSKVLICAIKCCKLQFICKTQCNF